MRYLILLIVAAVIVVGGHDALTIVHANRDVRDTAQNAAGAAAAVIYCAHGQGEAQARVAADRVAQAAGDVVSAFSFDPVAQRVHVTAAGNASSWVAGNIQRSWTDDITSSRTASPAKPSAGCPAARTP